MLIFKSPIYILNNICLYINRKHCKSRISKGAQISRVHLASLSFSRKVLSSYCGIQNHGLGNDSSPHTLEQCIPFFFFNSYDSYMFPLSLECSSCLLSPMDFLFLVLYLSKGSNTNLFAPWVWPCHYKLLESASMDPLKREGDGSMDAPSHCHPIGLRC